MKALALVRCCAVWITLLLAPPAAALDAFAGALPWDRLASAHPGEWAEYAMRAEGRVTGPWLRFLVVGPAAGGEGIWLEVWISSRPGSATQAWRMLLTGDPAAPGGVARLIGRSFGGPSRALELPPPEEPVQGPPGAGAARWIAGEDETLLTEAGSIRARSASLYREGVLLARSWVAPAVPVFGLVRLELQGGGGLELHAWGRAGRGVVDPAAASGIEP